MKNILIIGATGQIGSELTMLLRKNYSGNVVAGYIPGAEPKGELKDRDHRLWLISPTLSKLQML